MIVPLILILAGLYIYLQGTGWTLVFVSGWSFYWGAALILLGLLTLLRKK